ncbi:MAG TPA: AAA domain-containing protein [Candidatus Dormibacteraeota bacterium]|nr:AAA domain-containing protein [Candidatus Dormibacteraeota bacterium]
MSFLEALNGHGNGGAREHFAAQIGALDDFAVIAGQGESPEVTLLLPGLDVSCTPLRPARAKRDHTALRVDSVRPAPAERDDLGNRVLRVSCRRPMVSAVDGIASDTFHLMDLAKLARGSKDPDPILLQTLALVDGLESAERNRAATQRTPFDGVVELWRCRNCRGLWRADRDERCPSCGKEFTEEDRRRPELGRIEFSVPKDHTITISMDSAVMVEPEDEPHYLGRVTKVDHRRRLVEVACKAYEAAGSQGWITPSFNKQLYASKRSTLASIASGDARSLLLAQLLTDPTSVYAPEEQPRGDWLTPGMHSNPAQDRAIGIMVDLEPGQAALIQGPPGTGKTTVIVEAIKHRLAERPEQRILVCSHSNLAVDNALERLAGTDHLRAVRVAKAERVHPAVDSFRVEDEDDERLITANVFFATCATAATSSITNDEVYDMVILDEANKARIDEALPCLRLGAAVVMVGDHKQLPPVEDDAIYQIVEDHPDLEEIVDTSLFQRCWEKGVPEEARCLLVEQHRMHPEISAYISSASYDNQLENAPEVLEYQYVTRRPFPVALHMVDTAGLRGGRERRGAGGALRNDAEVRVCAQVVRILDERADPGLSLAVIAMYADQVDRLRQALSRRHFRRQVRIDTVDSFEGREEDMVVISLVRSNERGRIGFLRVPNRLNVAISRAKRLVVCVGDAATLRAGEETMYGRLVEAARGCGGYLMATELLGGRASIRPRPARRGVAAPSGSPQEGDPNAPRRNRRRRHRHPQPIPGQAPLATGTTAAAPPVGEAGDGSTRPARRRRRRHRSRGGWTGIPTGGPEGAAAAPPPAGTPRPPGEGARHRRNRHRRRGPRPLGDPSSPGGGVSPPPAIGGGSETPG